MAAFPPNGIDGQKNIGTGFVSRSKHLNHQIGTVSGCIAVKGGLQ
jgi:hypothetical protein